MALLGRQRRLLNSGILVLVLAASAAGAPLAEAPGPDNGTLRPPSDAAGAAAVAATDDAAAGRDAQKGISLVPTAAELEPVIRRTLGAADLESLASEAAGGAVLEADPRVRRLSAELGLRPEALARLLETASRQDVPPEQLAEVLAAIVARHHALLARVQLLEASDPRSVQLRDAVAAALATADYELVDALLAEAEAIGFEALQQVLAAFDQHILKAAAIDPEAGARRGRNGARHGVFHGPGRRGLGGLFCGWHAGHPLCEQWADSSSICDRQPDHPQCDEERFCDKRLDHPLCDGDRFCKKRPNHPLCDDDSPPSPN